VGWLKRHDVDIGWDAIEVGHVVGMRSVWFEADVVRGEVALELQIVVGDLLEGCLPSSAKRHHSTQPSV
jgi:hypothetical protein